MAIRRPSRRPPTEPPAVPGDLLIAARTLVEGVYEGRHRTARRGGSTEFFDYRAYSPGDPPKLIDWKLAGRTDRLYVRRFQHEAQLTVLAVVDASASMAFVGFEGAGDGRVSKWRRAQELAAATLTLAVRQGDRAGLIVAGEGAPRVISPAPGLDQLHRCVAELERTKPAGDGTLAGALEAAAATAGQAGLVVAISDALDEPSSLLERVGLLRARRQTGWDVALIQTLTDDEIDPEPTLSRLGPARVFDPERSGRAVAMGPGEASAYRDRVGAHIQTVRTRLLSLGCRHALHVTGRDPVATLREVFGGT